MKQIVSIMTVVCIAVFGYTAWCSAQDAADEGAESLVAITVKGEGAVTVDVDAEEAIQITIEPAKGEAEGDANIVVSEEGVSINAEDEKSVSIDVNEGDMSITLNEGVGE